MYDESLCVPLSDKRNQYLIAMSQRWKYQTLLEWNFVANIPKRNEHFFIKTRSILSILAAWGKIMGLGVRKNPRINHRPDLSQNLSANVWVKSRQITIISPCKVRQASWWVSSSVRCWHRALVWWESLLIILKWAAISFSGIRWH